MKVYFTAAIYHRPKLIEEYKAIKKAIKNLGHKYLESFDVLNQKLEVALNPTAAIKLPSIKNGQKQLLKRT